MQNVLSFHYWKQLAAAGLVLSGLTAAGYWAAGGGSLHAQHEQPRLSASEAVEHANALSEAFRAASDRVMPAVVSIQHEIVPKLVRRDVRPRGGNSRLP